MRFHHLLAPLSVSLLLFASCQPLPREAPREEPTGFDLVPLDSLPREYGMLVAVTPHVNESGPTNWYELWFSDADTGRITLVSVWRPGLMYPPAFVKVIERAPAAAEPGPPEAARPGPAGSAP